MKVGVPSEIKTDEYRVALTPAGVELESDLFEVVRKQMSAAYARAGQQAVSGYWTVLEGLIPDEERGQLDSLRG